MIYDFLSALTFLVGCVASYLLAERLEVALLVPFAAGNFLYIAAADLLPEITTTIDPRDKLLHTLSFAVGLLLLFAIALLS